MLRNENNVECAGVHLSSSMSTDLHEMSTQGKVRETESRGWKQEFNDKGMK